MGNKERGLKGKTKNKSKNGKKNTKLRKTNGKRKNKDKRKGRTNSKTKPKDKKLRRFGRNGFNGQKVNGPLREARNGKEDDDYSGDDSGDFSGYGFGNGNERDNFQVDGSGGTEWSGTGPDASGSSRKGGDPDGDGGDGASGSGQDGNLERNRECLDDNERLNGQKGLILGWGKNDEHEKSAVLREVNVTVISRKECIRVFG